MVRHLIAVDRSASMSLGCDKDGKQSKRLISDIWNKHRTADVVGFDSRQVRKSVDWVGGATSFEALTEYASKHNYDQIHVISDGGFYQEEANRHPNISLYLVNPPNPHRGTRKDQRIGKLFALYTAQGPKGLVPNHGPRRRKVLLAWGQDGWSLHLKFDSLRTWDGFRDFDFGVALHPSVKRRTRLQAQYTGKDER